MDRSELVVLLEMVEILRGQLENGELPRQRTYVFQASNGKFCLMTHDELRRSEAAETKALAAEFMRLAGCSGPPAPRDAAQQLREHGNDICNRRTTADEFGNPSGDG